MRGLEGSKRLWALWEAPEALKVPGGSGGCRVGSWRPWAAPGGSGGLDFGVQSSKWGTTLVAFPGPKLNKKRRFGTLLGFLGGPKNTWGAWTRSDPRAVLGLYISKQII